MAINPIPDKIIGYRAFLSDTVLLGVAEVTLPDFEYMTETLNGAGIAGELDSPTLGHTQSMTIQINFRTMTDDAVKMIAPKPLMVTFRASQQEIDAAQGELKAKAVKITAKVMPKKTGLGKLESGKPQDISGEYEVLYLKVDVDSATRLEVDKLNYIFKVDGKDYLAEVRQHLGMETEGIDAATNNLEGYSAAPVIP